MERKVNKNQVELFGKLLSIKKVWCSSNHTTYEGILEVVRDSGTSDLIPILFSDYSVQANSFIYVKGQFRSRDIDDNGKLKVELYVYAQETTTQNYKEGEESSSALQYKNDVSLVGYVCKKPTLRTTPSGKQVSDILIACNFGKDKTAYIPCIAWGKQARKCGKYIVGTEVNVIGRLQSRKYNKVINDDLTVEKIAYELSISNIESCHDYKNIIGENE